MTWKYRRVVMQKKMAVISCPNPDCTMEYVLIAVHDVSPDPYEIIGEQVPNGEGFFCPYCGKDIGGICPEEVG